MQKTKNINFGEYNKQILKNYLNVNKSTANALKLLLKQNK